MTKRVRIENADTSDYQVLVEIWDKGYPAGEPDVLVRTVELTYPTAMTDDGVYITSSRYLVVKEAPKSLLPNGVLSGYTVVTSAAPAPV